LTTNEEEDEDKDATGIGVECKDGLNSDAAATDEDASSVISASDDDTTPFGGEAGTGVFSDAAAAVLDGDLAKKLCIVRGRATGSEQSSPR
jgi:hypothetical protein